MAELNFIVDQNALQTVQNTELTANFDEMKEALTEFVEPYTKLIVSEDAIASAKADRAKINSVANHIDSYRKAVKKVYTEPLKAFEEKCKELTAICDRGKQNIDTQVAEYERKRKEEKLFLLKEYFDNAHKEYPDYITWNDVYNAKWENKTYTIESAKRDIDGAIEKTDSEILAIYRLKSEYELSLLTEYKKTHDLLAALALNERLILAAEKEAERRRQFAEAEERRKQRQAELEAARARQEEEAQEARENITPAHSSVEDMLMAAIEEDNVGLVKEEPEPKYLATFRIVGTLDEIMTVKKFMNLHNIDHIYDGHIQTNKTIEQLA